MQYRLIPFLWVLLCFSCSRFDEPVIGISSQIEIKTSKVTVLPFDTVIFEGNLVKEGNEVLIERGFVYDVKAKPTLITKKIISELGKGYYASKATDLTPNTQYFVAAYAMNKLETVYGDDLNFYTPKSPPKITLTNTKSYSPSTMVINCSIGNDGGSAIIERGVCWNTSPGPKITDNKIISPANSNNFEILIPNLKPSTTYYVRSYASNEIGLSYGPEIIVKTLEYKLGTLDPICNLATAVGYNIATINANVLSDGLSTNLECGIIFGEMANTSDLTYENPNTQTIKSSLTTIGKLAIVITNLKEGTTYKYVAYVKNEAGISYGSTCSFTTKDLEVPTIEQTCTASYIGFDMATPSANVLSDGGTPTIEKGFIFGTSNTNLSYQNPDSQTLISSDKSKGPYNYVITSLKPNTRYYFRAYCKNVKGLVYGPLCEFKTKDFGEPQLNSNCINPTDISLFSAKIYGEAIDDGGDSNLEKGFVYGMTPSLTYTKGANNVLVSSGKGKGAYSFLISNLILNTTYYYKTYAINSTGNIVYGPQCSFKTTNYETPKVNSQCINTTDKTFFSAKIYGAVIDNGGDENLEKGFIYGTSSTIYYSNGSLNTLVSSLKGKGEFSYLLTNLSLGTTYYYRTYAKNAVGEIALGPLCDFKTLNYELPKTNLNCINPTDITLFSAKIHGDVTEDGGDVNIEKGFIYGTSSSIYYINGGSNTLVSSTKGKGPFSYVLTNLSYETTYYYRTYAKNAAGEIVYGPLCNFKTLNYESPKTNLNCINPTDITISSAKIYGEITNDGGDSNLEKGFVYGTNTSLTYIKGGENTLVSSTRGQGSFTYVITNLKFGTSYYYKTYAINTLGNIVYGPLCNFSTLNLEIPKINSNCISPTAITASSVKIYGEVISDGGDVALEKGFVYGTSSNLTYSKGSANTLVSSSKGIGTYSYVISNLVYKTVYYYKSYAINAAGILEYGPLCQFSTLEPNKPTVNSECITPLKINIIDATIYGKLENWGGDQFSNSRELGAIWSTSIDNVSGSSPIGSKNISESPITENALFSIIMPNLKSSTTYYYRIYAKNITGISYGPVCSLVTKNNTAITFSTQCMPATNIQNRSATLSATITNDGGGGFGGFIWQLTPDEAYLTFENGGYTGGTLNSNILTANITNLAKGYTYYYRAYFGPDLANLKYGPICSFTTTSEPKVVTGDVTNRTSANAVLNGIIQNDGGEPITSRGFSYTYYDEKTATWSGPKSIIIPENIPFSYNLTKTESGINIRYRAFATNKTGTSYGAEVSFSFGQ